MRSRGSGGEAGPDPNSHCSDPVGGRILRLRELFAEKTEALIALRP